MIGQLIGLLLWAVFDFVLQLIFEAFFAAIRVFDEEESDWPLAIFLFVCLGAVLGGITAGVLPARLLPEGPFKGMSLILVPVALGGLMEASGAFFSSHGRRTSHLATWYGGASMGLGLAVGRLGLMDLAGNL